MNGWWILVCIIGFVVGCMFFGKVVNNKGGSKLILPPFYLHLNKKFKPHV